MRSALVHFDEVVPNRVERNHVHVVSNFFEKARPANVSTSHVERQNTIRMEMRRFTRLFPACPCQDR
jgi:hypothetical protein